MAQSEIFSRFQKFEVKCPNPKSEKFKEMVRFLIEKALWVLKNTFQACFCRIIKLVIRRAPKSATPNFTQIATVAIFDGQYLANQKSYLSGISDRIRT